MQFLTTLVMLTAFAASVVKNIVPSLTSVELAMDLWAKSPMPYANLLGDYTHFGSGLAVGTNGISYWAQNFGRNNNLPKNFPKC
ncbi:hypothetical protein BDF19DRAFT_422155 [Syncephalis fuscata]|nr:hypothetical protein BDF19DRAFT_422155 [Syncephalis fuscata]